MDCLALPWTASWGYSGERRDHVMLEEHKGAAEPLTEGHRALVAGPLARLQPVDHACRSPLEPALPLQSA